MSKRADTVCNIGVTTLCTRIGGIAAVFTVGCCNYSIVAMLCLCCFITYVRIATLSTGVDSISTAYTSRLCNNRAIAMRDCLGFIGYIRVAAVSTGVGGIASNFTSGLSYYSLVAMLCLCGDKFIYNTAKIVFDKLACRSITSCQDKHQHYYKGN